MGKSGAVPVLERPDRARGLIDEIGVQNRVLWSAQARQAGLVVQFCDARTAVDGDRIAGLRSAGAQVRYRAGEFAATEVSMALRTSKYLTQRCLAMTRRVQAEAPDAWDAWLAGDIDQDKVIRINRALRRLVLDRSKVLLNTLVVAIAVQRTPEILGRWLNQFVAQVEPEQTDERLRRSWEDRYVSVRPDVDGISFLHAALSAVDAAAVDQLLNSLAAFVEPGDQRTKQQRRADALMDLVCGRVSNGYQHPRPDGFDTNTDTDDHLDDSATPDDGAKGNDGAVPESTTADPADSGSGECPDCSGVPCPDCAEVDHCPECGGGPETITATGSDGDWDARDWALPASAFRPDGHTPDGDPGGPDPSTGPAENPADPLPDNNSQPSTARGAGAHPGPGTGRPRPLPAVTIGVIVTAASLFGYSTMPGQLIDRSALVPADTIRHLAHEPGTLFYRLLTDGRGNLLDVTELGRFPSRKLGIALTFRDGTCTGPTCHHPATRSDIDHIIPVPDGATTGPNLRHLCRHEHRCKTHAGHRTRRTGPHTTEWQTPTGHTYVTQDQQFPVDEWPEDG